MLRLSIQDPVVLAKVCHALSTPLRLQMVNLLQSGSLSCVDIAKALHTPVSTVSVNVKILEEAGLIMTELRPAKNGSQKLCSLVYQDVLIMLTHGVTIPPNSKKFEIAVPIGNYQHFEVHPSCGFVCKNNLESMVGDTHCDDPYYFLHPSRINASLIWFRKGFVEYIIPIYQSIELEPESIAFTMEICSEAPGFNNLWKSDITMWIEGKEIGSWASPADFGDRRGELTPQQWKFGATQYGVLTEWMVNAQGSFVNGEKVSDITAKKLSLKGKRSVTMRIGVKEDAKYVGGLNIFGEDFGDYPQGIKMCIRYREDAR
ncbi:ArsR/SmtB family transcription factor [Scatolibacter rhodanostii]|uniref:ArsR/SmtB family transcription factor n=1 Tax=Scatolibacter rhodanostii TaxID=2014781 RepID=UPI001356468F|nr:helix-turn-helix domain-containing protein [Scatolibacter rhodanostii]